MRSVYWVSLYGWVNGPAASYKTATIKVSALCHHSSIEDDPVLLGYDTLYIGM